MSSLYIFAPNFTCRQSGRGHIKVTRGVTTRASGQSPGVTCCSKKKCKRPCC